MPNPERPGQRPMKLWLDLGFPNETPNDQIFSETLQIAKHMFEGVEKLEKKKFIINGTTVMTSIWVRGFKELKPRDQLTGEELEVRLLMLVRLNDFDIA